VRAINADGVESLQPASISFTILRPVWQRWWFLTTIAILTALAIYALYRYRVSHLIKLERVRTRIATDLHDDIGSSLSQIAILSEVVRQKVGDKANGTTEPLNLIADKSREMVDSMSDIVWAINPQKDHLGDLVHRMHRFAGDMLETKDIDYHFTMPDEDEDISLGADVRREVYLIFKECINNLVKHSAATKAEIEIKLERDFLIIKISDNGSGFDVQNQSNGNSNGYGGNGLKNMTRRTKNLGGGISVDSNKNEGTRITLKIPVGKKLFVS
jgi:signal transduction histidine kinase